MTKNKEKTKKNKRLHLVRRGFPYVLASIGLIAVAFFGSQDKFDDTSTSIDMRALAQNNFAASADHVAEMYIVSELADSMNSATAPVIKINYDSITSAISYASSISTEKLEKPNVVDISHLAAGVIKYEVKKGETIESIAEKYSVSGVTATMIRWSNNMKASQSISAGKTIYVPGRAGFAYTVKNGDTVKNLAVKYQSTAEEIIALRPDGVFISNGPGDPEDAYLAIDAVKKLRGKYPMLGICLGHQIIALSYGAKTYKLKFGHRGGNHPVKNVKTGKIEITSQNHSYAVDLLSLQNTPLSMTHINLLDGTVEGAECEKDKVFCVQYHPESAPGPEDSGYLFDKFIALIKENKNA